MKVSRILEIMDSSQSKEALMSNFGDPYLCQHNSIYKAVRNHVINAGFSFSSDKNEFYQALSLSQIESIQTTKVIPYYNNVEVVRHVVSKMKDTLEWNDICDNLIKNHLFHESCHGVARRLSNEIFGEFAEFQNDGRMSEQILRVMIEESFANTCELLSILEAQDPAHRIFFEWNSYVFMLDDRGNLKNAVNEFGFHPVFQFFIFSYLHSNFLKSSLQENEFEVVFKFVFRDRTLNPQQKKVLKALSKIAFKLNPRFREVTTSFYLRLHGAKGSFQKNLDINYIEMIFSNTQFSTFVDQLTRLMPSKLLL